MGSSRVEILDLEGNPIPNSRAIVWGNNAAWVCAVCGDRSGTNTLKGNANVQCTVCGLSYEVTRDKSRAGGPDGGAATGVKRC